MAYTSAIEGGFGTSASVILADSAHEGILVPDAELLFLGEFHRAGPDLVLTGKDGHRHIVPGYFSSEKHPALLAPNGASLSPDLVDLLAGSPTPGEYAQAHPTAPPDAIGKVEKVVGNVTVMRNGVAVVLHVGDAVFKSDVIQTGAASSCGISFPDGTALNLIANTRMALNDYSYDANGTSNDALFSLVEGTFAFVAGKVAHTGGMKIVTPVATMGIRGTTGYVQEVATITATIGNGTYSFAVVDDFGSTGHGQYDLIDQNGDVIATVSQTGTITLVTPQGPNGQPLVQVSPMSAAQIAFEQQIIQQVFQTLNLSTNPQSPSSPGSSTPQNEQNNFQHLLQENNGTQQTISISTGQSGAAAGSATINFPATDVTEIVKWIGGYGNLWSTLADWSDLAVPLSSSLVEILMPVKVTIDIAAVAGGLGIASGATLNIVSGGSLTVSTEIQNIGLIQINSSGGDPTLAIDGTVYLLDGGQIKMMGATAQNLIIGIAGTNATLINVDNTIIGSGTIGQGDGNLTLVNGSEGTIEASPLVSGDSGILIVDTAVNNSGLMEAAAGGTLQIEYSVNNIGLIEAVTGGVVEIENSTVVNFGGMIEAVGGQVRLSGATVEGGMLLATGTGASVLLSSVTMTGVTVEVGAYDTLTLSGIDSIAGTVPSNADAVHDFSIANDNPNGVWTYLAAGTQLSTAVNGSTAGGTFASGVLYWTNNEAAPNFAAIEQNPTNGIITLGSSEQVKPGYLNLDPQSLANVAVQFTAPAAGIYVIAGIFVGDDTSEQTHTVQILDDGFAILTGTISSSSQTTPFSLTETLNAGDTIDFVVDTGTSGNSEDLGTGLEATISTGGPAQITNAGTINITGTTTLGLLNLNNTGGTVTLEGAAALNLTGATINGGTINDGTVASGATITISGSSKIAGTGSAGAALNNGGVTVDANQTLTLDDVTVTGTTFTDTASGAILSVDTGDTLNLNGVVVDGGTLDIASGATLNLDNSQIVGVTLNDLGTINVSGTSTIDTFASVFGGQTTIASGQTLVLNDALVFGTVTDHGTISVTGNSEIESATVSGDGDVTINGVTLTLDNDTVSGVTFLDGASGSILAVDGGDTLTLSGVSISGGTIEGTDATTTGTIIAASDIEVTGTSTISGAAINDGDVTVASGVTLTLDEDTVTGVSITDNATTSIIKIDGGDTLTLSGVSISGGTIEGTDATTTGTIIAASDIEVTGPTTISGAAINNGNVTINGVTLTLDGDTVSGVTFLDGASGSILAVDGGDTLTLSGVSISGGTIEGTDATTTGTIIAASDIEVTGISTISGAAISDGDVTVASGVTLTLDGDTVTGTTFTDTATGSVLPILSVDNTDTLSLSNVTVNGGTINDGTVAGTSGGSITIAGTSKIENAALNDGQVTVASGVTLTLDGDTVTGTTFTDTATGSVLPILSVDNTDTLSLSNVTVNGGTINDGTVAGTSGGSITIAGTSKIENAALNDGQVTVASGVTLTLDGDTVTGTTFTDTATGSVLPILSVDNTDTLSLSNVTVNGGTINDGTVAGTSGGSITIAGTSKIENAALNDGQVTVASGVTLTLDEDTVTGVSITDNATTSIIKIDGGDTLTLSGVSISGGTIEGTDATTTGTIIAASDIEVTGPTTISGAAINNGNVTINGVTLTLDGDTVSGVTFLDGASGSILAVDGGDTLTLSGVSISGGTIEGTDATTTGTIIAASDIEVTGPTTISGAAINNGNVTINGVTLTLDNDTVSGVTFLDGASGSILAVDGGDTLTLSGVSISGGTIEGTDATTTGTIIAASDIEVTGTSTISGAAINDGDVTVASGVTLTLDEDTVTGVSITDNATTSIIKIDGGDTLTLSGVSISGGTIEGTDATTTGTIIAASDIEVTGPTTISGAAINNGNVTINGVTLTLDGDTVSGVTFLDGASGSILAVDGGDTLTLSGVSISGGTIEGTDATTTGTIIAASDIEVTGPTTISGAAINNGNVTINGVTLTLDGDTVSGVTFLDGASGSILAVDGGDTLTLSGVSISGGTIEGTDATTTGTIIAASDIEVTGISTISGAAISDGDVTVASGVTLTLDGDTVTGTTFTDTATGSVLPILSVDNTDTLSLSNVTVNGGTINDGTVAGTSGGSITIAGTSKIENAALNDGQVTVASGVTLTLDGDTVTGTTFTDTATGSVLPILSVDNTDTLSLSNVTVNGGTINDGTVAGTSGGSITIAGTSKIENAALNDGQVTVASGVTLTLDGDTVTGTTFTDTATGSVLPILSVDNTDTLSLSNVTVNGGTINDGTVAGTSGGSITIAGTSKIENAALNDGQVTVASGVTLTLDEDTVTGVSITDNATTSIIKIDGGDTLTLSGVSISGGTIEGTDATTTGTIIAASDIEVTGPTTISGAAINNGNVTINGVTLTLDGDTVSGVTFLDGASGSILAVDGGDTLTLSGVSISGGTIEGTDATTTGTIIAASDIEVTGPTTISGAAINNGNVTINGVTLTLDNDTVSGVTFLDGASGSILAVDGGDTLTLSGVSISGGTIEGTDATTTGTIIAASDIEVTGTSTISGAAINDGDVTVASGVTLTLDEDTVTGVSITDNATTSIIKIDGGDTLTLSGVSISGGTIEGTDATTTGTIIAASDIEVTGPTTISGAAINNGNVTINGVTLTLDGDTVSGVTFLDGASGSILAVDGGDTLTLSGVSISGGTIEGTDATTTGTIIAASDIEVTGISTISGAAISDGDVTVASGVTLTLDGDTVTGTTFTDTATGSVLPILSVDNTDTLSLSNVTVNGGTINDGTVAGTSGGSITIAGTSKIENAALNDGQVTVASGVTLTLDGDTVTGTTFTDTATGSVLPILSVDNTDTLSLSNVTVNGGTINDGTVAGTSGGSITIAGTSKIENAALNDGQVTVASGVTLTLDGDTVTGTTFTDTATGSVLPILSVDNTDTLSLSNVTVNGGTINDGTVAGTSGGSITIAGTSKIENAALNDGQVTVASGVTLTLDGDTVTGTTFTDTATGSVLPILSVDNTDTLSLSNVTVNGGTINDGTVAGTSGGSITIAGTSKIENAALNDGQVTVASGVTLTLDEDTVTGVSITDNATTSIIKIDGGDTLTLSGVSISGGTIEGTDATTTGTIIAASDIEVTGPTTISGAAINNGNVTINGVTLTLDGDTVSGVTFLDGASGSILAVDGGDTLTLSGVSISGGTIEGTDATTTGTIIAASDIEVTGTSTISGAAINDGDVTVASGVTLTLDDDTVTGVSITDNATTSIIKIDGGDTLTLSGVSISGGTIEGTDATTTGTIIAASDIEVTGISTISGAAISDGDVTVASGVTLTLDGDTVTGVSITDTSATTSIIKIDGGDTLTLSGVSISGGTINGTDATTGTGAVVASDIDVTGPTTISGAAISDGDVTVASGVTLTLDGDLVTGVSITDTSATTSIIKIDGGDTLTLSGVGISGGTINGTDATTGTGAVVASDIDVTGPTTISGAAISDGDVTVASGVTLTLDGDLVTGVTFLDSASGSILAVDGGDTLTLSGVGISGGTINGTDATTGTGAVVASDIDVTGPTTISGAAINNGDVTVASGVTLTLDNDTATGVTFLDSASGSILAVDGGDTLTLSGVSISGGAIDGTDATTTGTIIAASDIDVTGPTTISGAAINNGDVTVASGVTLTLDNDTATGVTFLDSASGSILAVDGGDTLTLSGVSISGGAIDGTDATTTGTIIAASDIEVTGPTTISGAAINNGDITTSGVTLTLSGDTLDDVTLAGSGFSNADTLTIKGTVTLNGATISGGSIDDKGTIVVGRSDASSTIDINTATVESGAYVQADRGTLTVTANDPGSTNSGTIEAIDGGTVTINHEVTLNSDGVTYTAATATNETGGFVKADGNGSTLTLNSIPGDANYGTEEAINGGVFDLNSGVNPNYVIGSGGGNYGTMEALSGGTFGFAGDVLNEPASANQTAGMITASGAHSAVDFSGDASGNTITNGGVIEADSGGTLGFNSVTVDNGYKIELNGAAGSPATMTIGGTVTFEAIIVPGSPSTIDAGSITLSDSSENSIISNGSAATLINAGNTISGAGTIGDGSADNYLTLDNQQYGVIDATGTNPLILNTGTNSIANSGQLEATSGGTLDIDSSVANSGGNIAAGAGSSVAVTSGIVTGGEISAAGTGATVKLENATITAGTVTTSNATSLSGGVIEVVAAGGANLSVLASADVIGNDAVSVPAATPWNDSGIALIAGEEVTITASGVVSFGGADNDPPTGVPGQTAGAGFIAPGLPNQSLVGEIGSGTPFEIGAGTTFIAPTSGELYLSIDDDNFGDNSGSWSASITVTQPLTNTGFVQIDSGANLELQGLIDNQGTIDVTAGPDPANLEIGATVTLCGGGSVTLDGTTASIVAATAGSVLDNDETISGAGTIGDGSVNLTLDNESGGTIDATGLITINTGTNTVINAGTLEATGGGTLDIDSAVDNTGTITANGGTVDVAGAVTDTGPATISNSGVLEFQSSVASTQTVTFDDATGTLKLDDPADVHATVSGLVVGDIIDLTNTTVTTAVWNGTTLTLNGTATAFTISSLPTDDTFAFQSDGHGHGGTDLAVEQQVETVGSSQAVGVEGNPIQLHFTDALTSAGSTEDATLTSFTISEIPTGATLDDASHDTFTITNGSVTLNATELADGALSSLAITPANDTNFTLSAIAAATDPAGYEYTVPATEAVTVDPLTPNVTWNGVAADTLTATEGTFTLHLLADSANSLSGDSGNSIQSVVLTGLAAGDSITDGTVNDTVTSTGTGETIDVSSWNLTNPLSVTTVNDTNFTLTATVTEQDADNPAQTSVATATEAVTVDPLTPNVTWNGVAADTLTATEGTFTLHLLADSANSLSGDSGNSIQSVVLTGLAAGDSITDGTVNDTVTSTGTGETIDVSSWNLTNPLSVTTVNDTNFTLTATVTEQDADNPAQTSVATATEAVTVDPLTPNVTWNGVAADTLTATEGTFTLHLLADSANSLSGDSGNSIQSVVLTGLAAGDSITDGTVNDTVTSTGTGETIDVSSWNLTNPLSVTTVNDTNFTLTATVTEQDADNPAQTSVATATEAVTVDPLTPNVTWNGVAADTLTATEGTFTLHLLADSANSLSGDSGNSIQSVVLTGLAAGDSITDGTVNDTVTSTGTGETIDVSSWNLTNPLSVTTVNDTNFTLTATVTEQDADNPAQTSVATATEAVTVADAPLTAGGLTVVAATPTIGDFFTLNDPAAQPVAHGINDSGQVVGYDVGQQSFLYSGGPDGSYTVLQVPNPPSIETFAYGINNAGEVVGYYEDGSAGNHGFLYSGGTYTTLDVPGGAHTQAVGINNSGQIVGSYLDGTTSAGFLDSGGTYTTLNDPSATNGTIAQGINDAGQIVGYYSDGGGTHGFLYSGGTYTTLNDPNATNGTIAAGINDAGQIVGQYSDGTGTHGFIYSNGSWTTIDAPSASQTLAFAINNSGAIAGYYSDQQGFFTGPEPGPVEGAPAQLDATFTDGNPGDHPADFTATINWGDNTSSTGTISYDSSTSSASEYSVAGSHTYAAGGNYNVSVTVDDQGGQSTTITGTAAVADSIANNATFEVSAPSGDTVVFAGGTGTLQLDNPSTFTGEIAGFTGTAPDAADSDEVELAGVWTTTSPLTGSGENLVVNLTDGAKTATLTFDDFSGSLSITNNGSNTFIFDPPAANGAKGCVSIGGPGHDHFVFQPGIGADTIANFNSQAETTGFDHFANVQNLQQLAAAITPDALGDPLSEHGHHDGVPLPGASGSYFQAHLQSLAHLN